MAALGWLLGRPKWSWAGRDVRRLREHCKIVCYFLRLFDFGVIHYDDSRRGRVWANNNLAAWVDDRRMALTAGPNFFARMTDPDIGRHWRADKFARYRGDYHFQGSVAEIQYKVLSKLSNWQHRAL